MPVRRMTFLVTLLLLSRWTANATIVTYEGDVFPDSQGWNRETTQFFGDRIIDEGWLVQYEEMVEFDPPLFDVPQTDYYRRSITEFNSVDAFFLEWRMETDGPRSGFPAVAPASIVAGGRTGVNYHFTIADDQVRFIRDSRLPLVFVDIQPGVPHTYRLELYGADHYRWMVDGRVVDQGIPEGAYPTSDNVIVFGAAAPDQPTEVRWDFVRYGQIPEPGTLIMFALGSLLILRPRRNR